MKLRLEKLYGRLTRHRAVRVIGLGWLVLWSVLTPAWVCRRQKLEDRRWQAHEDLARSLREQEERRAGLEEIPKVRLAVREDGCELSNLGPRPLAGATLGWRLVTIDATACSVVSSIGPSSVLPAAAERSLQPFARMTAPLRDCSVSFCPPQHDCAVVAECEAKVHRSADGVEFVYHSQGVVGTACRIDAFGSDVSVSGGVLGWDSPTKQRLAECFLDNYEAAVSLPPAAEGLRAALKQSGDLRALKESRSSRPAR